MADGPLGLIFLLVLVAVVVFAGLGSITSIHSTNFGNCTRNITGSWQNCSVSDDDADQMEKSGSISASVFTELGVLQVPIAVLALIGVFLLFRKVVT
jgi:hypothetical protein